MPKIEIAYDDQVVQRRLAELRERGGNLAPAMREIAGHLLDSVNQAFAREASSAGEAWGSGVAGSSLGGRPTEPRGQWHPADPVAST